MAEQCRSWVSRVSKREIEFKNRRELAEAIMAAAIDKVEKLGFTMMLAESDSSKTVHVKKHHVCFHRICFYHPEQ